MKSNNRLQRTRESALSSSINGLSASLNRSVRRQRSEMKDKSRMAQAKEQWQRRKLIEPCSTLRVGQYSSFLLKVVKRKRRVTSGVPSNKRLHLTANSAAFMRKAGAVSRLNARQVKRGVIPLRPPKRVRMLRRRFQAYKDTSRLPRRLLPSRLR